MNRSAAIELSPVELSLGEIFAPDKPEDRHLSTEARERQQLRQIMNMLEMLHEQVQDEERSRKRAQDAMEAALAETNALKAKIEKKIKSQNAKPAKVKLSTL